MYPKLTRPEEVPLPSESGSISKWIGDLRLGSDEAAQEVWQRYHQRLIVIARQRLKSQSRRVADESDVVVDAFDSFFRGAQNGRFPQLDDRDDLWQVLFMLTARKAINQTVQQTRKKRGGGRVRGESAFGDVRDGASPLDNLANSEPTPEFAAEVSDQCARLLATLDNPVLQSVATMKMEGYSNQEIAGRLDCQVRTVQRKLRIIRELWTLELSPFESEY